MHASAVSLLPYDFLPSMLLAFARVRPRALIIAENDWWPNLLMLAYFLRVPVYLLSARIHEKSFAKYKRMGWFLRPLLSRAQHIYLQTQEDKKRFAQLGLSRLTVLGDLKAQNVLAKHKGFTPAKRSSAPTLLVGSLHPGELSYYTELFVTLKKDYPDLRMILAPRHFHWQETLVSTIESLGFSYALWDGTEVSQVLQENDIMLVCTLGKLFSLYSHADIFYLGGTFVPVGGHNLLEPAVFGIPAIVGPYYENTKRVADELAQAGGVVFAADSKALLEETKMLLNDNDKRAGNGQAARHWVAAEATRTSQVLQTIKKALCAFVIVITLAPSACQANPLFVAINMGKTELSIRLLMKGASTQGVDNKGNNALHLAVLRDLSEVALELIDRDRTLVTAANMQKETPLHLAALVNRELLTKLLLEYGANPNALDDHCWTPLHVAAGSNNLKIAELLINGGAIASPDDEGRLPRELASDQVVAQYLFDK